MKRHSYGTGVKCSQCGTRVMVLYGPRRVCAECAMRGAEPQKGFSGTVADAGKSSAKEGRGEPEQTGDVPETGEDVLEAGKDAPETEEGDGAPGDKKPTSRRGKRGKAASG